MARETNSCVTRLKESWMASNVTFTISKSNIAAEKVSETHSRPTMCLAHLRGRWVECIQSILRHIHTDECNVKRDELDRLTQSWFEKLVALHTDSGRKYHTLIHLLEMFGFVDILAPEMKKRFCTDIDEDMTVINLSVFFHDAIYNVKSGTNEEDSACLFKEFYEELLSIILKKDRDYSPDNFETNWDGVDRVVRYIMATKTHLHPSILEENKQSKDVYSQQLFLDVDMAVLGKESDAYDYYAALIRSEYAHVPHQTYCSKRAEILESFLDETNRDQVVSLPRSIFATKHMRDALEKRARENLRREIASLRNGIIPNISSAGLL